jgi:hypothetical protein
VLWLTGVLPRMLEAMDEVRWKMGATQMTLRNLVEGTVTAGIVLMIASGISAVLERRLLRRQRPGPLAGARSRRRCCAPCCCSSA